MHRPGPFSNSNGRMTCYYYPELIYIPTADRTSVDTPRIFCRIIGKPHPNRYQLQTAYGVLERAYPASELNLLTEVASPAISTSIPTLHIGLTITLRQAATQASITTHIPISCTCTGGCSTSRCTCMKNNVQCTNYCHHGNPEACTRLASREDANTRAIVPRLAHSISDNNLHTIYRRSSKRRRNGSDTESATTSSHLQLPMDTTRTTRRVQSSRQLRSHTSFDTATDNSPSPDIHDTIIVGQSRAR